MTPTAAPISSSTVAWQCDSCEIEFGALSAYRYACTQCSHSRCTACYLLQKEDPHEHVIFQVIPVSEGERLECKDVGLFKLLEWKECLCKCAECKQLYESHGLGFLVNPPSLKRKRRDEKESQGAQNLFTSSSSSSSAASAASPSLLSTAEKAFMEDTSLDYAQKMRCMSGYKEYETAFKEFLRDLVKRKDIVSAEVYMFT